MAYKNVGQQLTLNERPKLGSEQGGLSVRFSIAA